MSKNISSTISNPVQWENLADKIHIQLSERLASSVEQYVSELKDICQSPIEVMIGATFILFDCGQKMPSDSSLILATQDKASIISAGVPSYRLLVPQYKWHNYTIDFAYLEPNLTIFIECDGHDFHERTKAQAAHDRRRDREVQSAGIPILRFTGSQIYADPCGCVLEIYDHIFLGWGRA